MAKADAVEATPSPESDRRLGKYRLLGRIATGGMADVFVARLEGAAGFAKRVVIKRILPHLAAKPEFIAMFLREAHVASSMSHPNICQVFDLGESSGQYFLAMEYLEGLSLARAMRRLTAAGSAMDLRLAASIISQACEGLHYAHELTDEDGTPLGVVHRDVSPQNLFLTTEGVVKLLDFGVAKVATSTTTQAGEVKGKHAYMPPEQLRGRAIDRRADLFAVGVCAWEIIAGRRLFRRDTDFLTFEAIISDPIPRLGEVRSIPLALEQAVMRALERDVDARFATAQELGEAVLRATSSLGPPMSVAGVGSEVRRLFAADVEGKRSAVRALSRDDATPTPTPRSQQPLDLANSNGLDWEDADVSLLAPATPPSDPDAAAPATDVDPAAPVSRFAMLPRGVRVAIVIAPLVVIGVIASVLHSSPAGRAAPVDAPSRVASVPSVPSDAPAPMVVVDAAEIELGSEESPAPVAPVHPAAPSFGFLTIDAKPFAKVFVDGKELGVTPLFRRKLIVGSHKVRAVSAAGTKTFTITISRNGTTTHNVSW